MSLYSQVSGVIDCMGEASACAQDLKQAITSGAKVRAHSGDHTVYLLVDHSQNAVVGLLKVQYCQTSQNFSLF